MICLPAYRLFAVRLARELQSLEGMKVTLNIDGRARHPLGQRFAQLAYDLKVARQTFQRNAADGLHSEHRAGGCGSYQNYLKDLAACCAPYHILLDLARLLGRKVADVHLRTVIYYTETGRPLPEGRSQLDNDYTETGR